MKPITYWEAVGFFRAAVLLTIVLTLLALFFPPIAQEQQKFLSMFPHWTAYLLWPTEVGIAWILFLRLVSLPRLFRVIAEDQVGIETFWIDGELYFPLSEIHIGSQPAFTLEDTYIPDYISNGLEFFGIKVQVGSITFDPPRARRSIGIVKSGSVVDFYDNVADKIVASLTTTEATHVLHLTTDSHVTYQAHPKQEWEKEEYI
jgi:hypothetical protein